MVYFNKETHFLTWNGLSVQSLSVSEYLRLELPVEPTRGRRSFECCAAVSPAPVHGGKLSRGRGGCGWLLAVPLGPVQQAGQFLTYKISVVMLKTWRGIRIRSYQQIPYRDFLTVIIF